MHFYSPVSLLLSTSLLEKASQTTNLLLQFRYRFTPLKRLTTSYISLSNFHFQIKYIKLFIFLPELLSTRAGFIQSWRMSSSAATLSNLARLLISSSLASSASGIPVTSIKTVNIWESTSFSLMKRYHTFHSLTNHIVKLCLMNPK